MELELEARQELQSLGLYKRSLSQRNRETAAAAGGSFGQI